MNRNFDGGGGGRISGDQQKKRATQRQDSLEQRGGTSWIGQEIGEKGWALLNLQRPKGRPKINRGWEKTSELFFESHQKRRGRLSPKEQEQNSVHIVAT